MSENFTFHPRSPKTEDDMQSLLKGMDFQICLMRIIKSQIENCMKAENELPDRVCEEKSRYGKSGYMADVELDERGEIKTIRYDWVEP